MQKGLHIDPEKCTGCLQCEMACSFENYGVFAPAKSRLKVFDFHDTGKKVPYTCTQCDEAWCLHACPVEAITLDQLTGAQVLDTLGLISTSFGNWQGVPGGEQIELTESHADAGKGRHLSLRFKGDVLVGCNSVGWTEHVGVMRGLVEGAVRLGP